MNSTQWMTQLWRYAPLLVFLLLGIFLWRGLALNPRQVPSMQVGKQLATFVLPSLTGQPVGLTSRMLTGKMALLNVWASWCFACTEEQVFLLELADKGVPIFGLNYKDSVTKAQSWLQTWGNPYRMVGADLDGRVAIDLGVTGAPETFLIDAKGVIRHHHAGIMTAEVWSHEFLPVIARIKQQESGR